MSYGTPAVSSGADYNARVPFPRATPLLLLLLAPTAAAPQGPPPSSLDPPPPVVRPKPPAKGEPIPDVVDAEETWPGLPPEIADKLAASADRYREYAVRFTSDESVRAAKYTDGEATSEEVRQYGYLLDRGDGPFDLREFRQKLKSDGSLARGEVKDEEPFPPAYAWVFLFSRMHQPFFAYRDMGERFEGFDLVREIRFRGALPYSDGRDIRQWEGSVLVDVTTGSPVELHAEPSRQMERIRWMFDRWSRAFNIIGFRTAPRPFGYRCRVTFGLRQDRLSFPTELRYDTFRAVSSKSQIPWSASIRTYEGYRFFKTATDEQLGDAAPGK